MSPEEPAITRVREAIEAFNRGDIDEMVENSDPEIEIVRAGDQPAIRGVAGFRAWLRPDAFESQLIEPLEFRLFGSKVLVRVRNTVRGAGSGIETDFLAWSVWTFNEDGRTSRVEIFLGHQEAEAVEAARRAD